MIKADHKKWARAIFNPYLNLLLKKNFSNFYLANEFPQIPEECSLIITPNHISWWDGFFIDFLIRKKSKRRIYLMMLEEQLNIYKFFKNVGAFSISPGKVSSVHESLNYTKRIISDPANAAVIYPQGEIEIYEKRPLNIKKGLKLILSGEDENVIVIPVGFRIQHYDKKHPALLARFADPLTLIEVVKNMENYKYRFTENLDLLTQAASNKTFIEDIFNA